MVLRDGSWLPASSLVTYTRVRRARFARSAWLMLFAFHSFLIRAPICFGVGLIAMRVAQSEAAAHVGWAPEDISPAKFFPTLAVACHLHWQEQQWERQFRRRRPPAHPHLIRRRRWARTVASTVEVERRSEHRQHRRFCAARRHWKSLAHVRGGRPSWRSYLSGDGIKSQVLYLLS